MKVDIYIHLKMEEKPGQNGQVLEKDGGLQLPVHQME